MGNFSYLRFVPASIANIPIDWTRVPEASKEEILRWAYDWKNKVNRPLPTTVADLANYFDKSKFFGYLGPELCTLLMDISEFGLKAAPGQFKRAGPRFYMKYLDQVWFLLFTPGERDCIVGNSEDIIRREDEADMEDKETEESEEDKDQKDKENEENAKDKDDNEEEEEEDEEDEDDVEDYEEKIPAEELDLAQKFDARLEREISTGMVKFNVKFTKKLGGWDASMLQDNLLFAQYADAILTLPGSHPAKRALLADIFKF